jgi:hypothetical protein
MREVDVPFQSQLQRVDGDVELFRLTLQRAAVESDSAALDEVVGMVRKTRGNLAVIAGVDGGVGVHVPRRTGCRRRHAGSGRWRLIVTSGSRSARGRHGTRLKHRTFTSWAEAPPVVWRG